MSVVAIIPAAGWGVRMGSATPKQFLSLEGVPIFVHTLRKFVVCDAVDDIFLGLRAEDTERAQTEIEREGFARSVRLVEGGPSRQETVARCLEQTGADTEVVLVHDAVRPFIEGTDPSRDRSGAQGRRSYTRHPQRGHRKASAAPHDLGVHPAGTDRAGADASGLPI